MHVPTLVVVADDLTGAMDTAHGFATRGCRTRVGIGPNVVPSADVVAVNTDSRYDDPQTAASAVRRCVTDVDATVYKKVDSTLRGNVVAEIDAAIEATGAAVALVAPAFPSTGRTTRDGVHRVDGTPLDETEYAADENGPSTSDLPELLSASEFPVVHVDLDTVERGSDAIADAIDGAGAPVLCVCDATEDEHLSAIARSAAKVEGRVLFVGSGGLACFVDLPERTRTPAPVPDPAGTAPLGIVGSANEHTLAGLDAVADDLVEIDPAAAVRNPAAAGREAGAAAADRLAGGERAVVSAARRRSDVDRAIAMGEERGIEPADVRARVRESLATAARSAVDRSRPSGLFVTGGDVAVAVFDALDATSVSLTGEAVEAGIPIGVVDDGVASGLPVVTKAGGFGGEATVVNCLGVLGSCHG